MVIYKYVLLPYDLSGNPVPNIRSLLDIQIQNNQLVSWFTVDPEDPMLNNSTIYVFGTGQDLPDLSYLTYYSTFQRGDEVFHVYYKD